MKVGFLGLLVFVVILGLGVGAAFASGVVYGQSRGSNQQASTGSQQPQSTSQATPSAGQSTGSSPSTSGQTGPGGFGGFGGMAGGRPVATGTVEKVEGDTITVTTSEGTVKVVAKADVSIRRTVEAKVSDIKPGEQVVVSGERGADGTISASSIQVTPAATPGGRRTP